MKAVFITESPPPLLQAYLELAEVLYTLRFNDLRQLTRTFIADVVPAKR